VQQILHHDPREGPSCPGPARSIRYAFIWMALPRKLPLKVLADRINDMLDVLAYQLGGGHVDRALPAQPKGERRRARALTPQLSREPEKLKKSRLLRGCKTALTRMGNRH
jgi:hypothetical protein